MYVEWLCSGGMTARGWRLVSFIRERLDCGELDASVTVTSTDAREGMNTSHLHCEDKQSVPPMWLRLLSVTLAILSATCVNAQEDGRLCGRNLADALDLVCMGRGFHWEVKRTGMPVITKRGTSGKRRRSVSSRGVVEECCHNVCSIEMLERYCAYPASDSLLENLRQQLGSHTTSLNMPTTPPPSPPSVWSPTQPSSHLASNTRKIKQYFYINTGPRATRNPLVLA